MKKCYYVLLILVVCAMSSFAATHVFWYKALQNGYHLSDNPGPNLNVLPENVHEGMISCQSGNSSHQLVFSLASTIYQVTSVVFYDLYKMQGTITSAKIRAEYADLRGWIGPGPIRFVYGVEDAWKRINDPIPESTYVCRGNGSLAVGIEFYPQYALDTIQFQVPQGKTDTGRYPPPLAKTFFELDVTKQIQYILQYHDSLKSNFLILNFHVIQDYQWAWFGTLSYKNCDSTQLYRLITDDGTPGRYNDFLCHWSKDGNTAHLVVEGNLPGNTGTNHEPLYVLNPLLQNTPNPFSSSTTIEYCLPGRGKGVLSIFGVDGRRVMEQSVSGTGKYLWNAKGLPEGVYFCRLTGAGKTYTQKLVYTR